MRKKMKNKEEKHSSSKFFKGVFWGVVAGKRRKKDVYLRRDWA